MYPAWAGDDNTIVRFNLKRRLWEISKFNKTLEKYEEFCFKPIALVWNDYTKPYCKNIFTRHSGKFYPTTQSAIDYMLRFRKVKELIKSKQQFCLRYGRMRRVLYFHIRKETIILYMSPRYIFNNSYVLYQLFEEWFEVDDLAETKKCYYRYCMIHPK